MWNVIIFFKKKSYYLIIVTKLRLSAYAFVINECT